jgi:hypothetical protein
MKELTQFAIVTSMLCFLCSSAPRLAVAETRAVWTGGGEDNDVLNPDNWSWLEGPTPEGYPDDDTDVILDHTAVNTTLGFYDHSPDCFLDFNSVAVGNGTDRVTYSIVSYTGVAESLAGTGWFSVNNEATVDFKNIGVSDLHLLPGSTLRVEEDGHLVCYGRFGRLSLEGNLDLALPAEPSGEYVIAEYGRLTGEFASVPGLPPGWRIEYGSGEDDAIRALPEPSTVALLAVGALGLAARARRRRRRA